MKLQHFLETSSEYHPDRLLKALPRQLLHEYALLLSRQGQHEEVFAIYIHQLGDTSLAELYCDRIYNRGLAARSLRSSGVAIAADAGGAADDVYSCLFRVLLRGAAADSPAVASAIALAQSHFDRIDACTFIDLLPSGVPLRALQDFLALSTEYTGVPNLYTCDICMLFSFTLAPLSILTQAKRRNLQIVHQLLRVKEVKLRTSP